MENFDTPESRLEITDAMIVAKGLLMLEDALTFIQWVELTQIEHESIKTIRIGIEEFRKIQISKGKVFYVLERLMSES